MTYSLLKINVQFFLFIIYLSFIGSKPTSVFTSRIYSIGINSYDHLADGEESLFTSSTKHQITNFPKRVEDNIEEEIIDICGTKKDTFYLTKDGDVYGSGDEELIGIPKLADIHSDVCVPTKISFPTKTPLRHMFCAHLSTIFCSHDFNECYGIGRNQYCNIVGCEAGINTILYPLSIVSGRLNESITSSSSLTKITNVFVAKYDTIVLLDNLTSSSSEDHSFSLFGTGHNLYGVLSIDYDVFCSSVPYSSSCDWMKMNISSLSSSSSSSIKHIVMMGVSTLFVIDNENEWFVSGNTMYSTCQNLFDDIDFVYSLTKIPNNFTCYSFRNTTTTTTTTNDIDFFRKNFQNELIGKNIQEFQCSYYHCFTLTNESEIFTWGMKTNDYSSIPSLGRNFSSFPSFSEILCYSPRKIVMNSFDLLKKTNDLGNIEMIEIQKSFVFLTIMDYTENRKRIFAFGEDKREGDYEGILYFDFIPSNTAFLTEVFTLQQQNYSFTSNLRISRGIYQELSIFLLDTSICWGHYSNDSSNECFGGYCFDRNECRCTGDEYIGDFCNIPICFGIPASNVNETCNGNGVCKDPDTCACYFEQTLGVSPNCSYSICFDLDASNPLVCSAHGSCIGIDNCQCDDGYGGENCDEKSRLSLYIVFLSFISSAFVLFFLFSLVVCCFCFFICILCLLSFSYIRNRKKMKKFSKLKHLSYFLLQEEQLLEEKSTSEDHIAHLRINKELFQIQMNEIRLKRIIGEGGSNSTVYLVLWHNKDAAFKCFKTKSVFNEQQNFDEFEKEVEILGSISHPNIIRYYGACLDPLRTGFVMEYCPNGDLDYFMRVKQKKQENFEISEKIRMLIEIASAMSFLHSKKIIHRDLKTGNVLLDSTLTCKVMDFGASRFIIDHRRTNSNQNPHPQMTKQIGTSYFMSPEMVLGDCLEYSNKIDVFSFGVLMFIVLTEEFNPYDSRIRMQHHKEKKTILSNHYLTNIEYKVANDPSFRPFYTLTTTTEKEIPIKLKQLSQKCWNHQPEKRPSFEEILKIFEEEKNKNGEDQQLFPFDNLFLSSSSSSSYIQQQQQQQQQQKKEEQEKTEKTKKEHEIEISNLKNEILLLKRENSNLKNEIFNLKDEKKERSVRNK